MADNRLCNKEAGKALATMLAGNTTLKEFDVSKNSYAGCDGPGFAQEFADGIRNNGALVKFAIRNNDLGAEGGKALAEALKDNTIMKELNTSSNFLGYNSDGNTEMSGVIDISGAIPTMGAMKKLTISGDHSRAKPVTIETSMTEADFSDKLLGTSGATMLAAFLPKCR
jgi:uncharacterized protein with LGFP repeats